MARQQMKIAAETMNRYVVARALLKFASMIVWAPKRPPTASFMFGMAINVPSRKIAPMTKAPMIEARTALGASRLGSFVSSASVEAVSKP